MVRRAGRTFVNWVSICYFICALIMFIYLWMTNLIFAEWCTNILGFIGDVMYVVIGALIWPGTLLALIF